MVSAVLCWSCEDVIPCLHVACALFARLNIFPMGFLKIPQHQLNVFILAWEHGILKSGTDAWNRLEKMHEA